MPTAGFCIFFRGSRLTFNRGEHDGTEKPLEGVPLLVAQAFPPGGRLVFIGQEARRLQRGAQADAPELRETILKRGRDPAIYTPHAQQSVARVRDATA